jgi:hypothetical protein
MKSGYVSFDEACAGLSDKVITALKLSVVDARERLRVYRQKLPDHAVEHSQRGLANMINDWMWASLNRSLHDAGGVTLNDSEPTRELGVGIQYRVRVKRQRRGRVSSYPTETFLQFQLQGAQRAFPGMEEIRLNAGYVWDEDARSIGDAVLSLFDGREKRIWSEPLPEIDGDTATTIRPAVTEPLLPIIEVDSNDDETIGPRKE